MPSVTVSYEDQSCGYFEWEKDSVLIGRERGIDIDLSNLEDRSISRTHARIERKDAQYEILDIGATNPIYVNGAAITRQALKDQDRIDIGTARLVFLLQPQGGPGRSGGQKPRHTSTDSAPPAMPETIYISPEQALPSLHSLQISRQRLLGLYDLSRQFYAAPTLADLLLTVLRTVCRMTRAGRAFAAVFDEDLDKARPAVCYNMALRENLENWPVSHTILSKVVTEGQPVMMADVLTDPALCQVRSIKEHRIRSAICFPLIRGGQPRGILYADNQEEPDVFGSDDLDLFKALSLHVEAAMQMAQAQHEMRTRNDRLQRENLALRSRAGTGAPVIGSSAAFQVVLKRIDDIARLPNDAEVGVLVTGETGTGKELVAQEIFAKSSRKDGPFIVVNCAAIPDTLIEAELFGTEKGVATGVTARPGLFEAADGGILFLDEIGDMNLLTQAKVLRAIQNRSFVRVGARTGETSVDVWVVAATNKDLRAEVAAGRFRDDLFYRLKMLEVVLPPLRDRGRDVEELALFFLRKFSETYAKDVQDIDKDALELIARYRWPGNIRDLSNVIATGVAFCHSQTLGVVDLPECLRAEATTGDDEPLVSLEEMEKQYLSRVLRQTNWNKAKAARILNLGRQALYHKIEKYRLEQTGPSV